MRKTECNIFPVFQKTRRILENTIEMLRLFCYYEMYIKYNGDLF